MSPKRRKPDLAEPTFIADENFSAKFVEALRDAGAKVEHILDHFKPGTPDSKWLVDVGQREWFVLSRDARQRRRKHELDAIKRAKVGQFILRGQRLSGADFIAAYVAALPRMLRVCHSVAPPFIYHVNAAGKLRGVLAGKKIPSKRRRWRGP